MKTKWVLDMRTKPKETWTPTVLLCLGTLCFLGAFSTVNALTATLVLQQSPEVMLGQAATYICAATGSGPDPTFIWKIREPFAPYTELEDLTSQAGPPEFDTNSTDGSAKSQLVFIVDGSRLTKQIYCGAIDSGSSSPRIDIFAWINLTSSAVDLGEGCTLNGDVPCGQFAYCDSTTLTCTCSAGYYDNNGPQSQGTCVEQIVLGNPCNNNIPNTCIASNSFCNGTCSCLSNYIRSGSLCIPVTTAGLGESCTNPSRTCVIQNSQCVSGLCQCNSNYYQLGSATCARKSVVGEICNTAFNISCSTTLSYCDSVTSRCTCPNGFVYTFSPNTCTIPTLGQGCSSNVGCVSNSPGQSGTTTPQCINNVCQCPSDYYSLNGVCNIKAGVGSSCNAQVLDSCRDSNSQCSINTGLCICNVGYSNNQGVCTVIVSTGYCSSLSQFSNTTAGVSVPQLTPDVTVNKQCYEVSLGGTVVLHCADTRGAAPLRDGGWRTYPDGGAVDRSTTRFINGDFGIPSLTISNVQSGDDGFYTCFLCYGQNQTRCTSSVPVEVQVNGTAISSVFTIVSDNTPVAGDSVTFTCQVSPANVTTSYEWLRNGVSIQNTSSFILSSIQAADSGTYVCVAANEFGSVVSTNQQSIDVQYRPTFNLPGGGSTINIFGNLNTASITITCSMSANPAITQYRFYDPLGRILAVSTSNTYQVTESLGYGTYRCNADNSVGTSESLFFSVQLQQLGPSTGASTEDDGVSTGTIAAIVIGIIFFILLIIIIIICCCTYGWCRKKEKVQIEPVIVEQPKVKPYIPRSVVSATSSTVSRKDVGVLVNGHTTVISEPEEPRYATPRYYLKPAHDGGPIISMYDNTYEQPRAHQLPGLDTQYLYTDEEPRKRHKKKRKKKHRHTYREEERPIEQTPTPPTNDDEDLIVIPGKRNPNYFE